MDFYILELLWIGEHFLRPVYFLISELRPKKRYRQIASGKFWSDIFSINLRPILMNGISTKYCQVKYRKNIDNRYNKFKIFSYSFYLCTFPLYDKVTLYFILRIRLMYFRTTHHFKFSMSVIFILKKFTQLRHYSSHLIFRLCRHFQTTFKK